MKILTKKKQKRLMFDLIDIFLMGSDALKAVGTRQPMDETQALQHSPDSDRRAFFKFGGTTYFITRDGKVLSSRGDGYELHEIAQYNGKGYRRVRLRGKTFKVHRLVAEAFLPNPDNLPYVLHIDGDRENNICRNLEWSAKQSNHAVRFKG